MMVDIRLKTVCVWIKTGILTRYELDQDGLLMVFLYTVIMTHFRELWTADQVVPIRVPILKRALVEQNYIQDIGSTESSYMIGIVY